MNQIINLIQSYKTDSQNTHNNSDNIIDAIFSLVSDINHLLIEDQNILMFLYNQNQFNVLPMAIKFLELGLNIGYLNKNGENILFYILHNINKIHTNINSLLFFLANKKCDPYIKNSFNISSIDLIESNKLGIGGIYYRQIMDCIKITH